MPVIINELEVTVAGQPTAGSQPNQPRRETPRVNALYVGDALRKHIERRLRVQAT